MPPLSASGNLYNISRVQTFNMQLISCISFDCPLKYLTFYTDICKLIRQVAPAAQPAPSAVALASKMNPF